MGSSYSALKALHITAAVLMVGNVTVTGVWAAFYFRWRKVADFRMAARVIGQPVSASTRWVNPWPSRHQVFTCSTGPLVLSKTNRSVISAGARHWGQPMS